LHVDEDFQNDMADTRVRAAVESLTKNPADYDALVQMDSRVASVVAKMRVVHAALKVQGRTLALGDAIVPLGELTECRVEDAKKLKTMQMKLDQLVRNAVATAGGGLANESEANRGIPRQQDALVNRKIPAQPVPRAFIYVAMLVVLLAIAFLISHAVRSNHIFDSKDDL
jgi:hypothetical protein